MFDRLSRVQPSLALALALLSIAAPSAYSQSPARKAAAPIQTIQRIDKLDVSPDRVTAIIQRAMRQHHITGLSIAVFNFAKPVYIKSFGERNASGHLPLNDTTVMYAASFTKAMFAYMVMQLVDEKKLDLDKPAYTYLPQPLSSYDKWKDIASDERYKKITARMLLDHTSGLPNFRALDANGKLDIKFDPGSKYGYSGEGINLLGFVVEQITKKSLTDVMNERIFKPFGMTRTSMVWQSAFNGNYAVGHDSLGKPLPFTKRESPRAAGSASTTIRDMALFFQAVLEGRGLTPQSRAQMFKPQIRIRSVYQFPTPSTETTTRDDKIRLSYGLGWGVFMTPYGPAFFKEGHDDGWGNYLMAFDDAKTGMIIMTNSDNGERAFPDLLSSLIGDTYSPNAWNRYGPISKK